MKINFLVALLLAGASLFGGALAQAQVHPIYLYQEGEDGTDVVKALKARIGVGSRYALLDKIGGAEITLIIVCLPSSPARGYSCSYSLLLFPQTLKPLMVPLAGPYIVIGPDAVSAAEKIFQEFVSATSDETLKASEEVTRNSLKQVCSEPGNKSVCQP